MEYLFSIALFAITTSVTPGPNNILVMTSGLNFGVRKSLPLLTGICVGFTIMLIVVGLGFGYVFSQFPHFSLIVKIAGTFYLVYLAYLIANSHTIENGDSQNNPLSFLNGALFQWVNAKAWIVAIGAISAFTNIEEPSFVQNLTVAAIFLLLSFPCVGVWLAFGTLLRNKLKSDANLRKFNLSMSFLLLLSVYPVIRDIIKQIS